MPSAKSQPHESHRATAAGDAGAVAQSPLFRQQVLVAQQATLIGSIRLSQPASTVAWAMGGALVIAAIVSLLIFGTVTKRATVTGVLMPAAGVARLVAPAAGVLSHSHVLEGQSVAAGEILFELDTERISAAGSTSAAVAAQLETRRALAEADLHRAQDRAAARTSSLSERLTVLEREFANVERDATLANSRLTLARRQKERTDVLAKDGFVSAGQQQAKEDDVLAAEQAAQALTHNKTSLERERASLRQDLQLARASAAQEVADAQKALALLRQEGAENEARRGALVRAPYAGVITSITAQTGQAVAGGQALAQLLPAASADGMSAQATNPKSPDAAPAVGTGGAGRSADAPRAVSIASSPLLAYFYVPTRAAGFVETGQTVKLRYAAYPYQKFGMGEGTVTQVDRTPYALQELPAQIAASVVNGSSASSANNSEPVYRVTVALQSQSIDGYGQAHPLKPGMVAEADIVQRSYRLYEQILEPLRGFTQRRG